MTNYNGPDGFTAHCSNCGHLKIRHSFIGSRCPGTFEQGPVVQQENSRQKQIDSAEWVSRVSDALAAAKELICYIEDYPNAQWPYYPSSSQRRMVCAACGAEAKTTHHEKCPYGRIKECILAAH